MDINSISTVCVVGWARTGIALCDLLLSLGKKVLVTDSKQKQCFDPGVIGNYSLRGVSFEFGGHSEKFIKDAQLAVLSPGVDIKSSEAFRHIHCLGTPYVGELEFCFRLTKSRCIAITGTNGKTTTATLIYEVLRRKRKGIFCGGNIGIPFASFVLKTKPEDIIVLEVSSFQLETISDFRPYISVLLNINPDHLDRYRDLDEYAAAKMNIFQNQKKSDFAVLNKNVILSSDLRAKIKAKKVYFSREFDNENFSCVYKVVNILGFNKDDCRIVFNKFRGLPHRCQFVRSISGIDFINDSKATNPASTLWALSNITRRVILIAGGKDKGLDYTQILPYAQRIKKINLFGAAASSIAASLSSKIPCSVFSSLEEVVRHSWQDADKGEVVLFSPMCSSYDMFSDYQQRGSCFVDIVNSL